MNVKELWKGNRKVTLFIILGGAGVLLIFLSSFLPKAEKTADVPIPAETAAQEPTNEEYEKRYQQRIEQLVAKIDGVGAAQVTVTLDSGIEYVYAKEESKDTDRQSGSGETLSQRDSIDQKTILIEDENGRKKALLRTTLEPRVRGVVVVCEGGGDARVAERVTEAVKTALGISSTKVCVTKMS